MKVNGFKKGSFCLTGTWDNLWREALISKLPEDVPYFDSKDATSLEFEFAKEDARMIVCVINSHSLGFFTALNVFFDALKEPEKYLFCSLTDVPRKRVLLLEKILVSLGATVSKNLDDVAGIICETYFQN